MSGYQFVEEHSYIRIAGGSGWWERVKRVCIFPLRLAASIMDQPEFGWQMEEDFWEVREDGPLLG